MTRKSLWVLAVGLMFLAGCGSGSSGQADALDEVPADGQTGEQVGPPQVKADIQADVTVGNAPLTVHFTATYSGVTREEAEFAWSFDNGSTSVEEAPVVVFTEPRTYKVTLTVKKQGTIFSDTADVLIAVHEAAQLHLGPVTVKAASKVAPGAEVLVSFTLINSGGKVDTPFPINVYLSQDEVLGEADPLLKTVEVPGMDSGVYGDATLPFQDMHVTVPADAAQGVWYVLVLVDPDDVVNESDEEDNLGTGTSIVNVDPKAGWKPDLVLADLVAPEGVTLSQGNNLNYQLTITNQGQAAAQNFHFAVYLSLDATLEPEADHKITDDDNTTIFALGVGETRSFVKAWPIPSDIPDGKYHVIAWVDSTESVDEGDEDNNLRATQGQFVLEYAAPQGIDLAVQSFESLTKTVYIGGALSTRLVVRNAGTQDVNSFSYTYYISKNPSLNPNTDLILGTFEGVKVVAGGQRVLEDLVQIKQGLLIDEGTYYVSVFLDRDNLLKELDEGNNTRTDPSGVEVTKTKNVDLEVTLVEFHPVQVDTGVLVTFSHTVRNNGSTPSGGFFTAVVLSPDATLTAQGVASGEDLVIAQLPVGGVGAGESQTFVDKLEIPAALPHDVNTYTVAIFADVTNAITGELDEANNLRVAGETLLVNNPAGGCYPDPYEPHTTQATAHPLEPGTYADLGLCAGEAWYRVAVPQGNSLSVELSLESPLYLEPKPYDLDLQVVNAAGQVVKSSELIGDFEKAVVLGSSGAQDLYLRVFPKKPGYQAHYTLKVSLTDPDDGVQLTVDKVVVTPTSIYPGGLVQVIAEIFNIGKAPSGDFSVALWLSADPLLDAADLPIATRGGFNLGGLGNTVLLDKFVLPVTAGGLYYVLAQVDSEGVVDEADEEDNVGSSGQIFLDETLVCQKDAFEPNDSQPMASPLAATSGLYTGLYVCPQLDDWYALNLEQGTAFAATLSYTAAAGKGTVQVQLYDEGLTAILDSSQDPAAPGVSLPYVYHGGAYFLRVSVLAAASGASQPYEYSLGVSLSEPSPATVCPADPLEFNNSFELASPLGCGPSSHVMCNRDVDVFALSIPQGGVFKATLNHAAGQLKVGLYLEPGEPPVDQTAANGTVQIVASSSFPAWLVVEPVNPKAIITDFEYQLFVDGVHGVDLTASVTEAFPEAVVQGEDTDLAFTLENACMDASGPFSYGVYLSADAYWDVDDVYVHGGQVAGLGPKGKAELSQKVSVPLDTAPGPMFLLVKADVQDQVAESNEGDNVAALPITVKPVCQEDPFEPNDNPSLAGKLTAGTYPGLVLCKNDLDWFRVNLAAGATLSVTLAFDAAATDLDARLYAATNFATYLAAGVADPQGEVLTYTAQEGGWYYLRVAGFAEAQGDYSLEISIE
jgi:PKD repeat protein